MNRVHRLKGPGGQRVVLIGGIFGLSADDEVVRREFERERPASVLLGIPYEDLDAIRATAGKEQETSFESSDVDDVYVERLRTFGEVHTPPPDLYAAYDLAEYHHLKVEAIDLSDEAHTETYTKNVGFFEVLRSNRRNRRMAERDFAAKDVENFAIEWDDAVYASKGLQKVQTAREEHMTAKIQALAPAPAPHLVLLPFPRAIGVRDRLVTSGWTAYT